MIKCKCKEENMTEIFKEALVFATDKHKNQKRKGTNKPYIIHIFDVVEILLKNGATDEQLVAGALHDTVEDTGTTLQEIEHMFGKKIAEMVDVLTEKKALPYVERKHLQVLKLSQSTREVKMIKCADCLANIRSTVKEINEPNFWSKFNAPKSDIKKYYAENIEAMSELRNLPMYRELKNLFEKVFEEKTFYCTDCHHMKRLPDPDPYDWFCDDDEKYVCGITNKVLSVANRPYEKQIVPKDCPILNK